MAMTEHEKNLVAYTKAGNSKAFEELYSIYYSRILTLARVTVKNNADAEDILQQAFTNAWENIAGLSNPAAFSVWLQKITVNLCYRMLQKKNIAILMDIENDLEDYSEEPSSEFLPAIYAERGDLRIRLGRIIDGLSDIQKQTVVLFYFNELKVDEIAYIMDCNAGTVKKRLFLARRAIRTEIEEEERKSNEKFYGVAGIPMLALKNLFKDYFGSSLPSSSAVGAATAAVSSAKGVLTTTKIAVIAAIAVVCVGFGFLGVFLVNNYNSNNNPNDDDSPYIGGSAENPDPDDSTPTPASTPDPEPDDNSSSDDEPQDDLPDDPLYNTRELNSQLPRNILAYANRTLIGLKDDGTVVYAVGDVRGEGQREQLRGWSDIVSVFSGARLGSRDEFFGIRSNGTVVYTHQENSDNPTINSWTDIIDLSMDTGIIVGLRSDGTVVGFNGSLHGGDALIREIESWTNIVEVHALEITWRPVVIGLRADGTVVFTDSELEFISGVRGWTDIVSLFCGYTSGTGGDRGYIIGLKSDGTVTYAVEDEAYIDSEYITGWTDIIEISAGSMAVSSSSGFSTQNINVIGLKSDGTVVSTFNLWHSEENHEYDRRRTREWENVISVLSSRLGFFSRINADGDIVLRYIIEDNGSAFVRSDGTVEFNWNNAWSAKPEGVEDWTDIKTTPVIVPAYAFFRYD
jgi:RNA polymerase sigma factor (sigma-70 family)